jgi:hypothetical protein
MNRNIVDLGSVKARTLDFSGTNWWDALTFSMRKLYVWW